MAFLQAVTIAPGTTEKREFEFDRPGTLAVSFATNGVAAEGDTFVAHNTGIPLPSFHTFGTPGTYATTVTSPKTIFPFPNAYTVYAGTCEADEPTQNLQSINPSVEVKPNETAAVTVPLPAVNMQVFSGTSSSAGEKVTSFSGTVKDEGKECEGKLHAFSTITATEGELHKGMPFGTFTLCVASNGKVGSPTPEYKKLKATAVENKNAAGSSVYKIYLGSGEHRTNTGPYTCP